MQLNAQWQSGAEQVHRLVWLSDQYFVLSWEVIAAEPAVSYTGCTSTLCLRRVTELNGTLVTWITEFSSDVSAADMAEFEQACQRNLSDVRMHLQNMHQLLRVRYRPESRRTLFLQAVSDALMVSCAAAVHNNVLLDTVSLGHGLLSEIGVASLVDGLATTLVSHLAISGVTFANQALSSLLDRLCKLVHLRSVRLIGVSFAPAIVAQLVHLAAVNTCVEFVDVYWQEGDLVSSQVLAEVRRLCERNHLLNYERAPLRPENQSVTFVVNDAVDISLAERLALAIAANPRLETLHFVRAGCSEQVMVRLIEAALSTESAVQSFSFAGHRFDEPAGDNGAVHDPFLGVIVRGVLNKANGKRSRHPLLRLDIEQPRFDVSQIGLVLALVQADTPLTELFLVNDQRALSLDLRLMLADAMQENHHLTLLQLESRASALAAAADEPAERIRSVLERNRQHVARELCDRLRANDPTLRVLNSPYVSAAAVVGPAGIASAVRQASCLQRIKLDLMDDEAACALADALLENSSVQSVVLRGSLGQASCDAFTRLLRLRTIAVSLGPRNRYDVETHTFVHEQGDAQGMQQPAHASHALVPSRP